jgi:hypothetical protein
VLVLSARPSLASYIRRLEVHALSAARTSLTVLAVFARSGPTGSASFLASVQGLTVGRLSDGDEGLLRGLSACFPSLRVLMLQKWPTVLLVCIPSVFPTLHTLRMHEERCTRADLAEIDPGVTPLRLRAFIYTSRTTLPGLYINPSLNSLVARGLTWTHVKRISIDAAVASHLWPALCNAGTCLRHLFLHSVGIYDTDSLQALIPSPGTCSRLCEEDAS